MNEGTVPEFRLPASTGNTLELDSFRGKVPMVFVFLNQATERHLDLLDEIDNRLKDFGKERSQILPVMRLVARDARELADDRGLAVPVLADASGSMERSFGISHDADSGDAVAVVADKEGRVVRRFDPLPVDTEPAEVVESLLYSVRAIGSGYVEPGWDSGDDSAFLARIADEARVPEEEAPALVREVVAAISSSLGQEARAVLAKITPSGLMASPTPDPGADDGVEDVIESSIDEAAVASGRGAEHTRVVAEALADRADTDQLRRLIDAIEDEDIRALFESDRDEMTEG